MAGAAGEELAGVKIGRHTFPLDVQPDAHQLAVVIEEESLGNRSDDSLSDRKAAERFGGNHLVPENRQFAEREKSR